MPPHDAGWRKDSGTFVLAPSLAPCNNSPFLYDIRNPLFKEENRVAIQERRISQGFPSQFQLLTIPGGLIGRIGGIICNGIIIARTEAEQRRC